MLQRIYKDNDCKNNDNDLSHVSKVARYQKSYTVSKDKDIGTVSKVARYQNSYTVSKDRRWAEITLYQKRNATKRNDLFNQ